MGFRRRQRIPITASLEDGPLPGAWWGGRLWLSVALVLASALVTSRAVWEHREQRNVDAELAAWRSAGLDLSSPARVDPAATAAVLAWADAERAMISPEPEAFAANPAVWGADGAETPWPPSAIAFARAVLRTDDQPMRTASRLAREQPVFYGRAAMPPSEQLGGGGWMIGPTLELAARLSLRDGDDAGFFRHLHEITQAATAWETLPDFRFAFAGVRLRRLAAARVLTSFDELELPPGSEARASAQQWIREATSRDALALLRRVATRSAEQWDRAADVPPTPAMVSLLGQEGRAGEVITLPAWQWPLWWWARPLRLRNLHDALARNRPTVVAVAEGWSALLRRMVTAGEARPLRVTHVEPTDWVATWTAGSVPDETSSAGLELLRDVVLERLAATCLACRLYAIDHRGQDPARLDDLVPAYLPRVPIDPYDPAGGPIRMGRVAGVTVVYSLFEFGADGIAAGTYALAPGEHASFGKARMLVARLHPTTVHIRGTARGK